MKKYLTAAIYAIVISAGLLSFTSYSAYTKSYWCQSRNDLGDKNMINCEFPLKWSALNEVDDQNPDFKIKSLNKGYDTIMYFLEKHYYDLYDQAKINKKKEIEFSFFKDGSDIKNKRNYIKADNAYFVKTIKNSNGVKIDLYKDGGKFDNFSITEQFKVLNYLALIISGENGRIIDSKIIYYNCKNIIESDNSFFYLTDDLFLFIKKFHSDETDHYYKGEEKYEITAEGIKKHKKK
ncbi:hypothetical protein [Flavobacterium sp. H122]|uniref:hypothetical protein n=1 Tax=Flavobacterium sp. H122 TaxID=2529860 RepID=UPI0010AAB354|nr:hypothetical protein [Flavobacterium sp. H122]